MANDREWSDDSLTRYIHHIEILNNHAYYYFPFCFILYIGSFYFFASFELIFCSHSEFVDETEEKKK